MNDVIATTAFIGSIFGAGGGGEAQNSDLLAGLRKRLGSKRGTGAWKDVMLADDPEAPTTINKRFKYGPRTGGKVTGSVVVDAGSLRSFDPLKASTSAAKTDALAAPARRRASNFLIAAPSRSATGKTLAVMGPQLGYYYPEIVQQMHLQGAGINAQGAFVPGLAMYMLLGRTNNYAWSLTSAGHDVRDVYALPLCGSKGKRAKRTSKRYRYKGKCRSFSTSTPASSATRTLKFKKTVHGAGDRHRDRQGQGRTRFARKRSTFGRDALNLAALKDMTEGKGSTPADVHASRPTSSASRSTGATSTAPPRPTSRPAGCRCGRGGWTAACPRSAPASTSGRATSSQDQHPNDTGGPKRSAAELEQPLGAGLHARRRRALRLGPARRAVRQGAGQGHAGQHGRHHEPGGHRGRALARVAVDQQGAGDGQGAQRPRRSGQDDPGRLGRAATRRGWTPTTTAPSTSPGRRSWTRPGTPMAKAVMRPRFGKLLGELDEVRSLGSLSGVSYVDKDLRTLLKQHGAGQVQPALLRQGQAVHVPRVAVEGARRHVGHAGRAARAPTRPSGS